MNRASERKDAGVSLPLQQAEFKSNSMALTAVTKDISAIRPYKEMLDTNAEVLKDLAGKVIKTDVALANKPINWIGQNVTGSEDVAEFMAQMQIVQTEAARVLNNPRLVGQLTDSARHEMQNVIKGELSLGQTERVINRIQQDGKNRVDAMNREQERLKKAMRVGGDQSERATPSIKADTPAMQAPAAQYKEGTVATNPSTGEKIIFKGGQWQKM
jgi:hypothetical protein